MSTKDSKKKERLVQEWPPVAEEKLQWQVELEAEALCDERWACMVVLLVEDCPDATYYLDIFREATEHGARPVVKGIHQSTVLKQIQGGTAKTTDQNVNRNAQKSRAATPAFEVAAAQIKAFGANNLHTELMALSIKCIIMDIREKDILRRKQEILEAQERLLNPLAESENPETIEGEKDTKSKKGEKTNKSKKRESRDSKKPKEKKLAVEWDRINDEPPDGPEMYVALTGFLDPQLPAELARLGVPILGIVGIEKPPSQILQEKEVDPTYPKRKSLTTKKKRASTQPVDPLPISMFWGGIQNVIDTPSTTSSMKDIAIIKVPTLELSDTPALMQKTVYDHLCQVIFDIYVASFRHTLYSRRMKLCPLVQEARRDDTDLYDTMVRLVPSECTTVAFVLHCLVEQVCLWDPTPLLDEDSDGGVSQKEDMFFKLLSTDDTELTSPKLIMYGDLAHLKTFHWNIPELDHVNITVNILKYLPIPSLWQKYKHLDEIATLKYDYHIHKLWQFVGLEDVSNDLLRTYLHMLIFQIMESDCLEAIDSDEFEITSGRNCSTLTTQSLCSKYRKKWNHPRHVCSALAMKLKAELPTSKEVDERSQQIAGLRDLSLCPEIVSIRQCCMLQRNATHNNVSTSHHTAMEEIPRRVLLQTLSTLFNTFNSVKYLYFAPTDDILLNFYNVYDSQGQLYDEWMVNLRTPVGLRDFYEYTLDEEMEWIVEEETKYETMLKERKEAEEMEIILEAEEKERERLAALNNITMEDINNQFITIPKSEFRVERSRDIKKNDEGERESKGKEKTKGKEKSDKSNNKRQGKDRKSSRVNSSLDLNELPLRQRPSIRYASDDEPYTFVGFDLDPVRLQITGSTTRYYSKDGTEVKVQIYDWLYGQSILSTQIIKQGHTLVVNSYTKPVPSVDTPFVFHAVTAVGAIVAFEKRQVQVENVVPVPEVEDEKLELKKSKKGKKEKKEKTSDEIKTKNQSKISFKTSRYESQTPGASDAPTDIEIDERVRFEYDMKISLPSGLLIDVIPEIPEDDSFYIRQRYLTKGPLCDKILDESHRCFLDNGNILIFKIDGSVHVLCPNSTIYICKTFRKKEPPPPPPDPPPEENMVDEVNEYKKGVKKKGKNTPQKGNDKEVTNKNKVKNTTPSDKTSKKKERGETKEETVVEDVKVEPPSPNQEEIPPPPLLLKWEVVKYEVVMPLGYHYTVEDGVITQEHARLRVRSATDSVTGEAFTRRADGTNTLLRPDGSLTTTFPDGSHITTEFEIDQDAFLSDYDDFVAPALANVSSTIYPMGFKISEWDIETSDGNRNSSTSFSSKSESIKSAENVSMDASAGHLIQTKAAHSYYNLGFISLNFLCTLEHPNYATVRYCGQDKSCKLSMPKDMRVVIHQGGLFKIDMDKLVQLNVSPACVTFNSDVCNNSYNNSESIVHFDGFFNPSESENVFCRVTDCSEVSFIVEYNGKTRVEKPYHQMGYNVQCTVHSDINFAELEKLRSTSKRYIILHRDLSGIEIIHCQDLKEYMMKAARMRGAILDTNDPPHNVVLPYHTVLMPVYTNESQKWLMNYDAMHVLPMNLKRRDLSPKDSEPLIWLHPKPIAIRKEEHISQIRERKVSGFGLKAVVDDITPNTFVLRIIQGVETTSVDHTCFSTMDYLAKALDDYWNAAISLIDKYSAHPLFEFRSKSQLMFEKQLRQETLEHIVALPSHEHKIPVPLGTIERVVHCVSTHANYAQFQEMRILESKSRMTVAQSVIASIKEDDECYIET